MVHGGVIFTVADYAFAVACNSYGTAAVAVNAHISYLRAATQGRLVAEATEIAKSRRLGTYSIKVLDGEGELVAVFQGMAYRKDTPIAEAQERSAS
jgi:acyl-CoA thioesterase